MPAADRGAGAAVVSKRPTTVYLRQDQRETLALSALATGESQAALIRAALDAYLGDAPAPAPTLMHQDERDVYRAALRRWGASAQVAVAQEELAELVVALSHYLRGRPGAVDEVAVGCADVRIVLAQVELALRLEADVEGRRRARVQRLARLIAEQPA
ncbi:MAG: hypothetical protein NUW01_16920 [Gemmatimonadaceae bacterium]|nr:hypothetical protein [Gemmatimonadaceae bacterium]